MSNIKHLAVAALALVTLAVSTVVGITILRQFGALNASAPAGSACAVNNTACTALIPAGDYTPYITGLAIFGTFSTILAIVVIGKMVLDLIRTK